MTTTIQQNRYDQLLRRVGGIIGPGSKVAEVVTDLFPMIDVENVPGELLVLGGTRMAWGGVTQAAFAGLNNQVALFNPPDSGHLITVTRLDITSSNTQKIAMGIVDVELTAVPSEQFRDSRMGLALLPVGRLGITTAAAGAPLNWLSQLIANVDNIIRDDNGLAVLSPGFGLQLTTLTQNSTFNTGWMWRERAAERSELLL